MGIISAITSVFTDMGAWITTELSNLGSIFYADNSLTFLGVLAVAGLAISVVLLLVNMIRGFLNFGR